MDYDRVITLDEVFQKIDEVSADAAKEILEDIFDTDKMTSLSFVPSEED